MKQYKQAAAAGQDHVFKYIKSRMKEKKITQKELAEILQVGVTTLIRYFKQETPMPLSIFLEICGALELQPYIIEIEKEAAQSDKIYFKTH